MFDAFLCLIGRSSRSELRIDTRLQAFRPERLIDWSSGESVAAFSDVSTSVLAVQLEHHGLVEEDCGADLSGFNSQRKLRAMQHSTRNEICRDCDNDLCPSC